MPERPAPEWRVIFWGYNPDDGLPVYLEQEGSVMLPVEPRNTRYTWDRHLEDVFWGGFEAKPDQRTHVCLRSQEIGSERARFTIILCQVDVTLASLARDDVAFHDLDTMATRSGLAALDRMVNLEQWAAIAFIAQHHVPLLEE